ncbi:hypothetical protein C1I92_18485 [Jiangella anatolica]|uniref:DUF222 domain-containing protein n=1 Tax=Jiangella anatolica TaxID=2670374 RepID=A0A2W2B3T3_9ACTN|nr:DUF222 domain-containing protein [Jiangella anatolica]PZF82015.1 hypothetical protein C1I92_18485 [Jiangella anatolica]
MFEEALLPAPSSGADPVTGTLVAWHPDTFDWVRVDPADLVGGGVEPGFLERSAGVLPADADRLPTGAELAAVLAAFDSGAAAAHDLVEAGAELTAWVAAKEADVLAELAARPELRPVETGCRSVNPVTTTAAEVAARCQRTVRQAENLVGHALQLVADFPATHAALSAGSIDVRRARVIIDELGGQGPAVRARVEAAVLPKAPALDAVALRRLVRRRLHELAPVEVAERHRIARDGRYVAVTPASDGMAFLEALLPADDATALTTVLNVAAADAKRADAAAGVPARSSDQRRADALAELAWAALSSCADAVATGVPAGTPATVDSPAGAAAGSAEAAGVPAPRPSGAVPRRRPVAVQSPSRSAPSTVSTTSRASWRATGPSPLTWPARWPPRACGPGCAPTPVPDSCSTSAGGSTGRARRWPTSSPPATGRAACPAATGRPGPPTSTTSSRSPPAAAPRPATCTPSARHTTCSNTTGAGRRDVSRTVRPDGAAPPLTGT